MGKTQSLNIWLNGVQMGTWTIGREHSFHYADSWPYVIEKLGSRLPDDFPAETAEKIFMGMSGSRERLVLADD